MRFLIFFFGSLFLVITINCQEKNDFYSKNFLEELKQVKYTDTIELHNNFLIVHGDTIPFPQNLKLNKKYKFLGKRNKKEYMLLIQRVNNTTVDFDFKVFHNKQIEFKDFGQADLSVFFFLASEIDTDSNTNIAYDSYQYTKIGKESNFSIRIGFDKDENGKYRACVSSFDNAKPKEFNYLTLRTK